MTIHDPFVLMRLICQTHLTHLTRASRPNECLKRMPRQRATELSPIAASITIGLGNAIMDTGIMLATRSFMWHRSEAICDDAYGDALTVKRKSGTASVLQLLVGRCTIGDHASTASGSRSCRHALAVMARRKGDYALRSLKGI